MNGAPPPPPTNDDDKPEPTIIERVHAAALEGIAANVRRWLGFQGHESGDVIEIQSLGVHEGNFKNNYFVHAFDAETAVRLAVESDGWADAEGLYFIAHKPDPAIASRGVVGARSRMMKDEGTSNADIRERCVLYIDVDAKRPKGISATTEHMDRAQYVASIIYADIASILGDENPLGFGHSGNGAAVLAALDHLPETTEVESTIRAIVAACAELYDMPKARLPVQIDPSVTDAKRLLPCWGTVKRKGVANEARHHRRTGLVCSEAVRRLGMDELLALRDALVARFGPNIPKKVRDALGKAATAAATGKDDSPWTRARGLPPRDVAKWLGVVDEVGRVTCPGCKRHGPSCMIKILDFGFRCGSGTCATKGKKGYRDNVDLTAEVRTNGDRWEALKLLGAEFGFSATSAEAVGVSAVSFEVLKAGSIYETLPDLDYIVRDLGIIKGAPTIVAGYGYSGKTASTQQKAIDLARPDVDRKFWDGPGRPVWGKFSAAKRVKVLHIDYEQGGHLTRLRYQRLARAGSVDPRELEGWLELITMPQLYLNQKAGQEALEKLCEGQGLVIIDAFLSSCPGLEENSSSAREPLDVLTRISERQGCAFEVIHHARKPSPDSRGGSKMAVRGSSAIFDGCASVLVFDAEKGKPTRVVHDKERNRGITTKDFDLVIEDVGEAKEGLRVRAVDVAVKTADEKEQEKTKEQVAVDAARLRTWVAKKHFFEGRDQAAAALNISTARVGRAIGALLNADPAELVNEGNKNRPYYRYVGGGMNGAAAMPRGENQ